MEQCIPHDLVDYIETEILPRYASFDAAHRIDHARMVIEQSRALTEGINASAEYKNADGTKLVVSTAMTYVVAAFHDTGLCEGREQHHVVSARIIRADQHLPRWFTAEEIAVMADAAEDHRASAKLPPRTIYGRIVAEADRFIEAETIIRRTVQFGFEHYPELSREEHRARAVAHLREKYGDGGYLRLWFPESPNAARLEALRALIRQPELLEPYFEKFLPQR